MAPQIELSTWTPTSISFAERQKNRIKRLRSLRSARKQASINNYQETVAEEARGNLPPNSTLDDQAKSQETEKAREDHDGVKLINTLSVADAERVERKKRKNPDEGFSTYEQATVSQNNGLVENMPSAADTKENESKKQKYDDAFDGVSNVHEDREEAIDKMVNDLSEEQIVKRARYSSCGYNDDADIDSINDNKETSEWNLNRFYGENTTSKQNLVLPFCCWCKLQQYAQYLSQI